MQTILDILLPLFGLILGGFVCRRSGVIGPHAASELNNFVVWLALPAVLFNILATATWHQLAQPAFIATFSISCAATFGLTLAIRLSRGQSLAAASIDAIATGYPNTAYIGIPLCLAAFGTDSILPTAIATIIVACILFAITVVLIEISLQTERRAHLIGLKVFGALARNPLIIAPLAGAVVSLLHLRVPTSIGTMLTLLSGAATPGALICLGAFLAERRNENALSASSSTLMLSGIKLLIQPAIAWWLAAKVFDLSASLVGITVVLAALPTGTGPFMLAEFYRLEAQNTSRTILFSTIGSIASLSLLIAYFQRAT